MNINQLTRKDLLALPVRPWNTKSAYDSVVVLGTGEKHDSGYGLITVVGMRRREPIEIAVNCADDLEWIFPPAKVCGNFFIGQVRTDMLLKARALHFWADSAHFYVGEALSSTRITMVLHEQG